MTQIADPSVEFTNTTQQPRARSTALVPGQMFFMPASSWFYCCVSAVLVALLCGPYYQDDSPWVGVALGVFTVIVLHLGMAAHTVPWIPGLAALVALVQWVLMPWASYHLPPTLPVYRMAVSAPDYFSFAVPATIALTAGLYAPLWSLGRRAVPRVVQRVPRDFVHSCDIMVAIGLLGTVALTTSLPVVLQYPIVLVSYLGFVGALAMLIVRANGWGWRLLLVLSARAILASADGVFHDLLLWLAYASVLVIFVYRLRGRYLVAFTAAAIVLIGALQSIKAGYRLEIDQNPDMALSHRATMLGGVLVEKIEHPSAAFTGDGIGGLVVRLNQGAIISHTLNWVPTSEPYAKGETLLNAIRTVVVPRAIDPGKYVAGGYAYFRRFTGLPLNRVSMNLSLAGEMYANFGRDGGILATGLFALMIGLIYRGFAQWAQDSPLWWAWAPYVLLYAMQAENGIGEVVNHFAKSALVMAAIVYVVPAWRTLRRWRAAGLARRMGFGVRRTGARTTSLPADSSASRSS